MNPLEGQGLPRVAPKEIREPVERIISTAARREGLVILIQHADERDDDDWRWR